MLLKYKIISEKVFKLGQKPEYTRPAGKKNFYHFEMEKIALKLIYNMFVTKNVFFQEWTPKKKFSFRTFLEDLVGWRQTIIFLWSGPMFSKYFLGHDSWLRKINLRILCNRAMKNFQVRHGQCDSITFPETFSLVSFE